METDAIEKTLKEQLTYFEKNAFKSFDLCDIGATKYFLTVSDFSKHNKFGKYILFPHKLVLKYFSGWIRTFVGIKKELYPQALIFICQGLLNLYVKTKDNNYRKKAEELIEIILANKTPGFRNSCWGQPYDWSSKIIIPAHTPRATVSTQVGQLLLDAHAILGNETYLNEAISVSQFFINEMPRSFDSEDQICFSYTAIDNFRVHNSNMMIGSFLASINGLSPTRELNTLINKVCAFTITHQNTDGSWYYASLPDNKPNIIDNYHTGYVLEALLNIRFQDASNFTYQSELDKGIDFYVKNLFDQNWVPKLSNVSTYPIDIQSCAQSIITFQKLKSYKPEYEKIAWDIFEWTNKHMYDQGFYHYRKYKSGWTDKTPYLRWGDAWMFKAGTLLI